ncbi:hypothetical protein [Brevibacillus marinus]|uniref:hypothetical protein n=1 Tax=Brevibacillus marinus TaxID=2496837 RepID=UPI000F817480|nr:hypothetical protein [Brevibacillus marinus]
MSRRSVKAAQTCLRAVAANGKQTEFRTVRTGLRLFLPSFLLSFVLLVGAWALRSTAHIYMMVRQAIAIAGTARPVSCTGGKP